jgi:RNA polymerase primary sigma factor
MLTKTRSTRSSLDFYVQEINAAPLLTADEERLLARRIALGDPEARDELVKSNLRLVIHLARAYVGKGLPLEDLISEGNMGLVRAAEGYDPAAGTRFVTYATYWIRQSIRRALNRASHPVRLPQYMWTLLGKWQRATVHLRKSLGREPQLSEIANSLSLTAKQLRAALNALKALSSIQTADDPSQPNAIEQLPDGFRQGPAEALVNAEELRVAIGSFRILSEREVLVLRMRFGLDGGQQATLKQIGEQLGYTRERVRQIEQQALAKLRKCLAA